MITLGPLTERAMEKDFPECWTILADMMGLEYDIQHKDSNNEKSDIFQVMLYVGEEEIVITKDNGISTTANVPKAIITQLIIHTVKTNRKQS